MFYGGIRAKMSQLDKLSSALAEFDRLRQVNSEKIVG